MGIRDPPITPRSPWQNGHVERLIGSIRRDCLDHVVVLGERHLRHLLANYATYNGVRTHLASDKDAPLHRPASRAYRISHLARRSPSALRSDGIIGRHSRPLAERLRRELEREYQRLELVQSQLRIVEKERDTADAQDPAVERKREVLCDLQGVGGASAAILAREVFARPYASRRQPGSYVALTPTAYDSSSPTPLQ